MMTEFTSGPWVKGTVAVSLDDGFYEAPGEAVIYADCAEVDEETCIRVEGPNARADANLIAAAPDMYEALEYIFDHIADKERGPRNLYPAFGLDARRAIEMARAALAKARGETP